MLFQRLRVIFFILISASLLFGCDADDVQSEAPDADAVDLMDVADTYTAAEVIGDVGEDIADTSADLVEDIHVDVETVEDMAMGIVCPEVDPGGVSGVLYEDLDDTSNSWHDQDFTDNDAALVGVSVTLLSSDGERETQSCDTGLFSFGVIEDGVHLLDIDHDAVSTSTNHARRFPDAVREGAVKVVTFGDSIPSAGSTPRFPSQFATLSSPLATIENINIAIPGTTSAEWLPGGSYFDQRLLGELSDADVIVFSLGGNDLGSFLNDFSGAIDINQALGLVDDVEARIDEVEVNLRVIIAAIRAQAPNADIAWMIYPNYAGSDEWKQLTGEYADTVQLYVSRMLRDTRRDMSDVEGLIIVDILGAVVSAELNGYLVDPLHLNTAGHKRYAELLFMTLGGVRVGAEPLGLERQIGFEPPM